jgi:hypothetical protein
MSAASSAAGATWVRSLRLGFLDAEQFRAENPQFCLLDSLGVSWILSSETRLFNGLRWIFAEEFFSALSPALRPAGDVELAVEAMRKGGIIHEASLT